MNALVRGGELRAAHGRGLSVGGHQLPYRFFRTGPLSVIGGPVRGLPKIGQRLGAGRALSAGAWSRVVRVLLLATVYGRITKIFT